MYVGGISFTINKSFGCLQLIPEAAGLRLSYTPIDEAEGGTPDAEGNIGDLDIVLPFEAVGGLWATARAFLYAVESLDENVIIRGSDSDDEQSDILVKLYRDKPKGQHGKLSGEEVCWLRLVTGRSEKERRRIKLGPRDLLCIELACNAVMVLSGAAGTNKPFKI